jgi:hypothetical protein
MPEKRNSIIQPMLKLKNYENQGMSAIFNL